MPNSDSVHETLLQPAAPPTGVAFAQVTVSFEQRVALRDVSLTLTERRVGIIGDNGSGKSTLARLINGLVLPSAGRVSVLGLDPAREGRAVRRKVGFMFQNPDSQIVMPTVAEDVVFGLKAHGVPAAAWPARCAAMLERLGIAHLQARACAELSGGERQLVALAGVLVLEPTILVCDEPTAMLDARNARRISALLETLPQQVIVVTHHVAVLEGFDRVVLLAEGQVAADGPAAATVADYHRRLG